MGHHANDAVVALEHAARAGLAQVNVRHADASRVASFADALPVPDRLITQLEITTSTA